MKRENQKKRTESVREEILDTALDIALSDGFEALSVRKLAERMQYSTGVIYYHFEGKDEIVRAIQLRQAGVLRDNISKAVTSEKSFSENLRDAFHEAFRMAVNEPEKYYLIASGFQSARTGSNPPQKNGLLLMLSGLMQTAADRGEISVSDVEASAFAIWSSFLGFHIQISQMGLPVGEAEKLFDAQVNIILYGLMNEVSK